MNLGTADRLLRIVLGTLLLFVLLLIPGWPRWFGLAGIVPLVTASLGWCPLYQLFGLDTCACETGCRTGGASEPPRDR